MQVFWETITESALTAIGARTIAEIGSDRGAATKKLMEYCERYDAVLHVIDPMPKFNVAACQQRYGGRFVMHQTLSLAALPTIGRLDAVLIDGDHNWYTVYNELKQIESFPQPFPLVFLHDIGWPYGRRDLYYYPPSIPEAFRQPYATKGMRLGVPELMERGGINRHFYNSVLENAPRSGVLTAVEDFLKEAKEPLRLLQIPGFYGLGILFLRELERSNEAFAQFVKTWNLPDVVRQYLELLEGGRLDLLTKWTELSPEVRNAE